MTQAEALDILKMGKNVFLTGSPGSGKTHLLNQYIRYLKDHGVSVAVTASTGIAATHMNGVTIHSWSGLGIKDSLSNHDLEALESKKYLWDRMQNTKVLIIDEVSMLHHFRLDLVERVIRFFKRTEELFGGIQVVLCGDFFQLPPVKREGERESHFIYRSEAWKTMNPTICYLEEQYRQEDGISLSVLNAIRTDAVTEEIRSHLQSCFGRSFSSSHEPTRLYTHNIDVDRINEAELLKIKGEGQIFMMTERGNPHLVETLKKSCLAPQKLSLKKGARVMFVKNNYEGGYVNGTLGTVVDFKQEGPIVETYRGKRITAKEMKWMIEEEGKIKAEITQVPLRLAWAITVHKSQGMSLDAVEVDLSKSFEKGMGYVALSRIRSFMGLRILGLNDISLRVDGGVLEFDQSLLTSSEESVKDLVGIEITEKLLLQKEYLERIAPKKKSKKKEKSTHDITLEYVLNGASFKEIVEAREMTEGTILNHLEVLVETRKIDPPIHLEYLKPKRFPAIKDVFEQVFLKSGEKKLSPVRDILGSSYSFEELRLARLFLT